MGRTVHSHLHFHLSVIEQVLDCVEFARKQVSESALENIFGANIVN